MKSQVNWIGLMTMFIFAIIMGFIGYSLPNTINFVNGFQEDSFYGHWASYVMSVLLFWIVVKDIELTIKRESYIVLLNNFIKNSIKQTRRK